MYFIQLLLVLIIPIVLYKKITKKTYCRIVFLLLAGLMCFRAKTVGLYDTEKMYLPWINLFDRMSLQEILRIYPLYRGSLLQILTKLYLNFSNSEELWIFLTSIPFCYATYKLVYEESKNVKEAALYFTLIITLRLYSTQFFTIRHGLASAMLVFAYLSIKKNKYVQYSLFFLLATMFHSTAIVFLIILPFKLFDWKINWKHFVFSLIVLLVALYIINNHFGLVLSYLDGSLSYYQNYKSEGGAAYTFPLMITCLYFMTFSLFSLKDSKNKIYDSFSFNILALATITMYGSTVIASFYRISYFFLIIGCKSIKDSIVLQKRKIRIAIYVIVFGLLFYTYYLNLISTNMIPYRSWLFN